MADIDAGAAAVAVTAEVSGVTGVLPAGAAAVTTSIGTLGGSGSGDVPAAVLAVAASGAVGQLYFFSTSSVVAVSVGQYHTAVLTSTGEVWAWGKNDYGQANPSSAETYIATPTLVATGATALACGLNHTMILRGTDVSGWGLNSSKQVNPASATTPWVTTSTVIMTGVTFYGTEVPSVDVTLAASVGGFASITAPAADLAVTANCDPPDGIMEVLPAVITASASVGGFASITVSADIAASASVGIAASIATSVNLAVTAALDELVGSPSELVLVDSAPALQFWSGSQLSLTEALDVWDFDGTCGTAATLGLDLPADDVALHMFVGLSGALSLTDLDFETAFVAHHNVTATLAFDDPLPSAAFYALTSGRFTSTVLSYSRPS